MISTYFIETKRLIRLLQERWQSRCSELQDWVITHAGALPTRSDQLACGFEIGKWLWIQKCKLHNLRLQTAQIHELDVAAPGWRDGSVDRDNLKKYPSITELKQKDAFLESLSALNAFMSTHYRFPARSTSRSEHEFRMAGWLAKCRRSDREGRLVLERAKLLDETVPGWRHPGLLNPILSKRWEVQLAAVVTFRNDFGRLPTYREPSGRWMKTQRRMLKAGKLKDYRESALDAAVPGWKGRQHSE